jgi:methionyl-tRNA formyltransferase
VRLVYLGTPEMAVPPLEALVGAGHDISLVVTNPDRRRGRGGATSPSPVKAAAIRHGIPVSHAVDDVLQVGADLGVVVAYGRLIKPHVLAELDFVNLHFSLLPRWRGAAPVERALLDGDEVTGVCLMALEEGLDTGGVYDCVEVPIGSTATADQLRAELVDVGARLLVDRLAAGLGEPTPQSGTPTYAAKIDQLELRIDWSGPVDRIDRLIRLGGAWTTFRGARFKIHAADMVDGRVVPTIVQPEGKGRMSYADWRNGARPADDEWFT